MVDVSGLMMMFLMDVSIKDHDAGIWHKQLNGLSSISCVPVPIRRQIKKRTVRKKYPLSIFMVPSWVELDYICSELEQDAALVLSSPLISLP